MPRVVSGCPFTGFAGVYQMRGQKKRIHWHAITVKESIVIAVNEMKERIIVMLATAASACAVRGSSASPRSYLGMQTHSFVTLQIGVMLFQPIEAR